MSTSKETIALLTESLEPLPVRTRAMFGEYGLYCEEKVVGFVCDDARLRDMVAATAASLPAPKPRKPRG